MMKNLLMNSFLIIIPFVGRNTENTDLVKNCLEGYSFWEGILYGWIKVYWNDSHIQISEDLSHKPLLKRML